MRCFLAIELPESVRECLHALQSRLKDAIRGVRWTRPDQIHLTLKFLGEVPDSQLQDACRLAQAAARRCPGFSVGVSGTGCFPPRGPVRVIWAGVDEPPVPLLDLQRGCEEDYAPLGYPPDDRAFRPHLTLGRVNASSVSGDLRRAVEQESGFSGGSFTATELVLFQSVLSPSGPTYTPMCRAPFRVT